MIGDPFARLANGQYKTKCPNGQQCCNNDFNGIWTLCDLFWSNRKKPSNLLFVNFKTIKIHFTQPFAIATSEEYCTRSTMSRWRRSKVRVHKFLWTHPHCCKSQKNAKLLVLLYSFYRVSVILSSLHSTALHPNTGVQLHKSSPSRLPRSFRLIFYDC